MDIKLAIRVLEEFIKYKGLDIETGVPEAIELAIKVLSRCEEGFICNLLMSLPKQTYEQKSQAILSALIKEE